jgi:hypothetical protein
MRRDLISPLVATLILFSLSPVLADYTLLLKNGRRITVQSYRDEGTMIKFRGAGGEIGIGKDQIQSIEKAGESDSIGSAASESGGTTQRSDAQPTSPPVQKQVERPQPAERQLSPEEERAQEEKEYQRKLTDITQQLKDARSRYSESLRGTTGPDPSLLTTEEQIKKLNDDAMARSLDARNNPVDPGVVKLQTSSPFSSLPPVIIEQNARLPGEAQQRDFSTPAGNDVVAPAPGRPTVESRPLSYTDSQRELSDLRNQAIQLEQDRQKLIDEMKQKNFSTGSLFLE